jgi:hypothetical protein
MGYSPINDPTFLSTVENWVNSNNEVFVLIRFHASAGAKSFEFFNSMCNLKMRLDELPPSACVTVFRDLQLPLRGRADDDFLQTALATIPDGAEFLLAALEKTTIGGVSWFHDAAGVSHAELDEAIRDCFGELVAVGVYPPWLEDNDAVISAVVPNKDGTITPGIY